MVNGNRTALAKWSILVRLPSVLKSDPELRFFVDHVTEAFRPSTDAAGGSSFSFNYKCDPMSFTREALLVYGLVHSKVSIRDGVELAALLTVMRPFLKKKENVKH